ncbi:E3 ubiquitin-protein ligase MYCBP2 isoform X3 [Halyomorpha halys]|uniref:E3 ubiquitin-protein ligase MYCBP2 isoform X3 n=1 Tax=Halyomorpha halys TaxID=286706 RepID=UPI0006D509E6|nr:E3 ubiquitin-protein ligase MYCBP2 isoform X3 [Halyomorpha halys]
MFPEPDDFGVNFYELFRVIPELKKKIEWKKHKNHKSLKGKENRKPKLEIVGEVTPEIEIAGNASNFAVFSTVRLAVLERWIKEANDLYLTSSSSAPPQSSSTYDSEEETSHPAPQPPKIPKIVGVGLRSVFELIRESRTSYPALCTKALSALLDVVQGHQPEALKLEPPEVVEPLMELLLELATMSHEATNDASHLTSVACSCLIALVIARGDTGKLLSALAALLMCPHFLAVQPIHMPNILGSLQKSVLGVILGKTVAPDWITHGVPHSSLLSTYQILHPELRSSGPCENEKAMSSDGKYLYIHTSCGLFKVGSGYGGTLRGHVYAQNMDYFPGKTGWLGYANGKLYFRIIRSGERGELLEINRDNLSVKEVGRVDCPGVMFSDGDHLGIVTPSKEDGFVVRSINPSTTPFTYINELPLKLARKCVVAFGYAVFDEETSLHDLNTGVEEETSSVVSGKEFSLIRTTTGKVLFSGKASSLGFKQGGKGSFGKWSELVVPKGPKISQVVAGHDGLHAVLVAEDGSVYFVGTARRGEDGDHSKVRRQPKAVKPKKIMKVEGYVIINAACNNGTTALVTKDGELFMFGKDTSHSDPSTGLVTDLKNLHITQVALGKAHAVAVTNKGHLYTFGINNKGQCGREFIPQVKEATIVAMETAVEEEGIEDEEAEWGDEGGVCPPGQHKWKHDLCMVCTVCRECTGYGISCLSSMRPDRIPGQECGCGEGDSGCSQCGACKLCANGESVDNSEMAILGPSGASDIADMMRLDLIFGGRPGGRFQDHLQYRLEERKQRQRAKLAAKHSALKMKGSSNNRVTCLPSQAKVLFSCKTSIATPSTSHINIEGVQPVNKEGVGSDVERDASRVTSLPPARVLLPTESPVVQVVCGLHHTVVLVQSGDVYTFGSNSYGQLGVGDMMVRGGPVHVKVPMAVSLIAAGSNHTVIMTVKGQVYTFGAHQKGQLGRGEGSCKSREGSSRGGAWQSVPGLVAWAGPRSGRRATWCGASGDQTFLRVDESLINSSSLSHSTIIANKTSIILVPKKSDEDKSFNCLVINKRDGNCCSFGEENQVDFSKSIVCLDPIYNVLWSYRNGQLLTYNQVCSEGGLGSWSLLSGQLALPTVQGHTVTRSQAALHILAALDTLTSIETVLSPTTDEKRTRQAHSKVYTKEDFSTVSRFESHGGGWGYSGHSIEAVRFMPDTDILIGGFGLFGGRGEYTGKIKLFDIGTEGGEQENDGELLAETEEIPYECGPRQKYPMLFEEPIPLMAHRWYVAWARVSGPSSDCGSSGQGMVTTEDQVIFYFKSSKKSNNGTDVNAGQIPQLLYRVVTPESQATNRQTDSTEPACILSREFSRTVSRDGLQSLLALLQWSWNTFKVGLLEMINAVYVSAEQYEYRVAMQEQERLVYISKASLRLLRMYTNEIYPNQISCKRQLPESVLLAECVGDIRALLKQILSDTSVMCDPRPKGILAVGANKRLVQEIMDECHHTFVSCFHAFYPTAYLKWTALCDLLAIINKKNNEGVDQLLTSVLASLRCPSIRLRSTFPILSPNMDVSDSLKKQLSPSDNSGLPMMPCIDTHYYPILVEQMSYRSQVEGGGSGSGWVLRDVLDRLLDIVTIPVKESLYGAPLSYSTKLSFNACHILARIVAELAIFASGTTDDMDGACGRVLHATPSRFTRTNQSRTWNTGNGSPDAICFSVDRSGIVVAGVGVYGGVGSYDYELELLDDSNTGYDPTHTQRWNSLQLTRGSFGPDDCLADDIAEIKFDFPIFIKDGVKYAIRLRNHGGRTSNGDGGLSSVKGPDGTNFTFSTCSLSFNGTTQTRGQIPYILYYSNPQDSETHAQNKGAIEFQARRITLNVTSAIFNRCSEVLAMGRDVDIIDSYDNLSSSHLVRILLPLVVANISPLATSDPRSAVQVLGLLQELLPHVSALNLLHHEFMQPSHSSDDNAHDSSAVSTTNHRAWVESDHPYKPATVSNYRVVFSENVQWMTLEFTPECGTAQAEDSLQLYIPALRNRNSNEEDSNPYWPVLHKFSNIVSQWPQSALLLPGNELIFSLETASDYVKDDKANFYGFKCLVTGYEWSCETYDGLKLLETELAFLGGMCSASLIKKDLVLPPSTADEVEEDLDAVEELAQQVYLKHSSLLGKGFALANPLSINQALDGILPYSCHSNERLFLRDLVTCAPGTSGGRLTRWLQPESFVDPGRCELLYAREEMRCGWPAQLTVLTKDQYGDTVHVPNLKIEVKAVPIEKKEVGGNRKMRRVSQPDELTFGGHAQPSLGTPYEVTVKDKMCYYAITIMKAYENYSFEELRYTSPVIKRSSENMLVRPNCDGTYSATWTPASIGWYSILATIDGYPMHEGYKVEVKEPPQGLAPPSQSVVKKTPHQPNKLRKFVAKNSAGLRVRAHPSLQSEQIGIVHVNGTIAFIDEIHNDDGVWLRLNQDTIRQYCPDGSYAEAWCLQFNQHLGKTLLLPVQEPKSLLDHVIKDPNMRKSPVIEPPRNKRATRYKVVKCGASGHNVRSNPSLKAPPVGMLGHGNYVSVIDHVENGDGTWIQLDKETLSKYCFNWEGEAWSLAVDRNTIYLKPDVSDRNEPCEESVFGSTVPRKGFDFGPPAQENFPLFTTIGAPVPSVPFVFGSTSHQAGNLKEESRSFFRESPKSPAITKCQKSEEGKSSKAVSSKDVPPELLGVSVKELVKAIGESRANGNGATPPDTPRRASRSSSPLPPSRTSSSSPLPIPAFQGRQRSQGAKNSSGLALDSVSSSPLAYGSPRSIGVSPAVYGGAESVSQRRGSTQSDTSALVSSLTRDLTPSPSGSCSLHSTPSTPRKNKEPESDSSSKSMAQAGTQTSPDGVKSHFSIGSSSREESPKSSRKVRTNSKRSMSPGPSQAPAQRGIRDHRGGVKEAMSPSVAESIRATFAALLWHEGLVHDAMACASFLKFHPTLPKQGALVVTRHTDRARTADQRHSLEVSMAGNYLHIKPSTLETLTRSAANANANRHRGKQSVIREELREEGKSEQEHTVTVLPPALKCLVHLWEQLTITCLQAFTVNNILPSPCAPTSSCKNGDGKRLIRKKKDWKGSSRPSERMGSCELCGGVFPHPVTYHMRQAHAAPITMETHLIMKNNAMFLLELSSGSPKRIGSQKETPPDMNSCFPPPGPFQCLFSLGVNPSSLREDIHFPQDEVVLRRKDSDSTSASRPVSEGPASDSDSENGKGRLFHRSVSMGTNGAPWNKKETEARVIMTETGSSLLCYPSAALQKLVPSMSHSAIVSSDVDRSTVDLLSRPVMLFLLQQHNLPSLHMAMKQALRKATCRIYGMQALDWLLHTVTQAACLHDLLWWFVFALTPPPNPPELDPEQLKEEHEIKREDHDLRGVCEHPLNDMGLAGEAIHPLPSTFHSLLQSIADLMLLLPMGSALQQMAVRCWGINFTQSDHSFLHRSHVFSNISKILSRSEEEQDENISMLESHLSSFSQTASYVEALSDLTNMIEIKASSRQAMVGSLTDNSTETFWESGDEDRNKTKSLTITCPPGSVPTIVYIHIDNCRDLGNKVSSVTFQSGPNSDELFKLRTVEVESRATGWISCSILEISHSVIRLELKGGDNSMRIRQVRVLGRLDGESIKLKRQYSASAIQQRNTEAETLRVFRLITSQVFGKLITGEKEEAENFLEGEVIEESNDLKEHMVGILFSRSKLTHLQKQVCVHIVQAIRKEAAVMREEWESRLCSALSGPEAPDTYCFEMLSMVLALSGSAVGRSYLAHQHALMSDLLSLLHTGSARVQRQVTALLRRMLAEVTPSTLAHIVGVKQLPPADFSIAAAASRSQDSATFDFHRMGILDVFLSCIAKALTVQVKTKGKESKGVSSISLATCIHPRDNVGSRWWLRGCISRKLAEEIIALIRDMASGKLSEDWARVTKGAIAENILNVTRLNESQRGTHDCLHSPTLWLALASLCVLDRDHVERLSSGQWRNASDGKPPPPRPTCNNHDDGETNAIIQCSVCGSLCAECDRYLHLHKRTRMHQRQVCKEEEEAIKVDLHEGCGRTKLFWALLLADSSTLKALVEFREGTRTQNSGLAAGVCRFCGASGSSGLLSIGNVCADHDCQEHSRNACSKVHPCGHMCGGIQGETECLPCLHGCSGDTKLKQDADDMCMICFTEALSSAPAIQLKCGHVFHLHCCRNVLTKRWAGPRITFSFALCPICKSAMEHKILAKQLEPVKELMEDVRRKALMRLEYEGLDKGRLDPAAYAMDRYAYYVCFKCKKAYYGGEARCDIEAGSSGDFDPSELVCGACSDVSRAQMCPKHGTDFLEYKCRYCCSVAVFFCFGTTHFCNACHDDFQRVTNIAKNELPACPAGPKAKQLEGEECPLHVKHPPTGEEFALGCGVCRNAHTF